MFNQDNPPNKPDNPIDKYARTSIDKIEEQKRKDALERAKIEERAAQYKAALNRLASSPDGKFVLGELIGFCGVFTFDNRAPDGMLAVEKGRREVYLKAIRPFLEPVIRQEIENQ